MKIRNIKIAIKSDEALFKEVKDVVGKIERGEKVKNTKASLSTASTP